MPPDRISRQKRLSHIPTKQLELHTGIAQGLIELADTIIHSVSAPQLHREVIEFLVDVHPVTVVKDTDKRCQVIGGIRSYQLATALLLPDDRVPCLVVEQMTLDELQEFVASDLMISMLCFSPNTCQGQANKQWVKAYMAIEEYFDNGMDVVIPGVKSLRAFAKMLNLHHQTLQQYIESRRRETGEDVPGDDGEET